MIISVVESLGVADVAARALRWYLADTPRPALAVVPRTTAIDEFVRHRRAVLIQMPDALVAGIPNRLLVRRTLVVSGRATVIVIDVDIVRIR